MLDIILAVATAPEVTQAAEAATTSAISGSIQGALGCLGAALGVGLVGSKAVEAIGRNPASFSKVLVLGVLGMALAEAVAFYALFLGK